MGTRTDRRAVQRRRLTFPLALLAAVAAIMGIVAGAQAKPAAGPLVVSAKNPRYFAAASDPQQRPIYLTGSHIWNQIQDGIGVGNCEEPAPPTDYQAFLDNVVAHNQNFIRFWRWEQSKFFLNPAFDFVQHSGQSYCVSPMPWARTGPGVAWDGRPKFDLTQFDPSYFSRLRSRVAAAGKMGVYTSVMLFEGLCMHTFACLQGSNILGHPFDGPNNINGIDINSPEDVQSLGASEAILNLEKAYIRKVVDTVHDEDNVLFEVADEALPSSNEWQDWVISYVRQYEQEKGYEMHPIGKTQQVGPPTPGPEVLFNSPADWVSPATGGDYLNDPPASDGTKVVIADADHYAPCGNTPLSGWKAFVRGLNPIMLDCAAANPTNPGTNPAFQSDAEQELSRVALGDTRRLAQSLDLAKTTPRGDLSSTGFALANPGSAYVVVQPEEVPHSTLSVTLERGVYWLRWFSIADREWRPGGLAIVIKKTMTRSFQSPFGTTGPTVLDIRGL